MTVVAAIVGSMEWDDATTRADVGSAIMSRRRELGLSQRAAAAKAQISSSTWGLWERGEVAEPRAHTLRRIADTLGWSVRMFDWIAEGEPAPMYQSLGRMARDIPRELDQRTRVFLHESGEEGIRAAAAAKALVHEVPAGELIALVRAAAAELDRRAATDEWW